MSDTSKYALIVDDDQDAQDILSSIISSVGIECHTASDGMEALNQLRMAEVSPPQLIMLDLMMPSMDGFAVYTWLRGNPMTRYVPVIVVTACAPDQIDMFRLPGVTHVVQKGSFTVAGMLELIKPLLTDASSSKS